MNGSLFAFGDFRLDADRRLLVHRERGTLPVTSRTFDALLHLVRNPGRLVTKRELMDAVWGHSVVEENNLAQAISSLRQVLGERAGEHRFVVTEPGRGYRFVAAVTTYEPVDESAATASGSRKAAAPVPGEPPPRSDPSTSVGAADRRSRRRRMVLVASAALAVTVAAIALLVPRRGEMPPDAAEPVRTIAVLPFKPLVPAMGDAALELGMADTLITRLAGGRLVVRPLSSVRKYAALDADAVAAGRALGVDAVLEGSLQRNDDVLRVTTRLIRVRDGSALWSDQFDRRWDSVFELQDAIAERVVSALAIRLSGEDRLRLVRRDTGSPPAYRFYVLGRFHLYKLTPPEIARGVEYFQRAIAVDPDYALPYAGLAEAHRALAITSDAPPIDALPLGKAAALKAIALDPKLDSAWASLCFMQMWSDWDWAGAERSCRRAIAIDPNGADGHRAYAVLLSDLGRHDDAIAEARRASELDPLSPITNALEGHVLLYAGRDVDALRQLRATLELEPDFWIAHLFLGKTHLVRGELQAALAAFRRAEALSHGNTEAISLVGYTLARLGQADAARRIAAALESRAPERFVPAFNIAMVYNGLGEHASALRWLERAYADRDVRLTFLRVEKKWDPMRGDPGFAALMARMRWP